MQCDFAPNSNWAKQIDFCTGFVPLCTLNNALLVSIGVVSAACWWHPEMETLIIQPGSANHFFAGLAKRTKLRHCILFLLHMPSRRVMLHNFCSSVRSMSATCQDCFWFDVVQETWLYVISPVSLPFDFWFSLLFILLCLVSLCHDIVRTICRRFFQTIHCQCVCHQYPCSCGLMDKAPPS